MQKSRGQRVPSLITLNSAILAMGAKWRMALFVKEHMAADEQTFNAALLCTGRAGQWPQAVALSSEIWPCCLCPTSAAAMPPSGRAGGPRGRLWHGSISTRCKTRGRPCCAWLERAVWMAGGELLTGRAVLHLHRAVESRPSRLKRPVAEKGEVAT